MKLKIPEYSESALSYLKNYYQAYPDDNFSFGFAFINTLTAEAVKIARSEGLDGYDFQNAVLAVSFRYAGLTNIVMQQDIQFKLLDDFCGQSGYPDEQKNVIFGIVDDKGIRVTVRPEVGHVVRDALDFRLAMNDLIVHISFLTGEINRLNDSGYSEVQLLTRLKDDYQDSAYFTAYAKKHYTEDRDKNFDRINKRIEKLQSVKIPLKTGPTDDGILTDKEAEDLFKIAFRNYAKLVSVADNKAALLIRVNSLMISVTIGFVIGKIQQYPFLIIPSVLLLAGSLTTILLSILASRPQGNAYVENKSSKSYQVFFFGSFDLAGNQFAGADYETYVAELDAFFKSGRENMYTQVYREVFNVRKVLGRKFNYLSYAYIIFLCGLFLSIVAFVISFYYKY
ncbi:Pycsar system effector family protein [Mucilaginibacter gilvus]|uniref:Pycsar effector protein domain-containing protein n=1 Tax=Mucilaginibacter gilvus TaxID=2305909 RepID=A0A444MI35_9SPHI|nr:Pycsar system effector family protein [Mucilaginibacter gilvus]RWY47362.1 hypothetical protein EPL05_21950 [Mucilaginibacter gilvus]